MGALEVSWKDRFLLITNVVFHQLLAVVVFTIIWLMYLNRDWTNIGTWHIALCVIGFGFFMAEAVILFNRGNILTINLNRKLKGYIHGVLMFLACCCVTVGIALKIYQKVERGSNHFTSTHGKLGLSSWIFTILAVILGLPAQFPKSLSSMARPIWFKAFHICLGFAAYLIGIINLGYGLDSYFSEASDDTTLALNVLLGVYVGYTLITPLFSLGRHVKTIVSN